ncbi:MAG: GntR family transcriptional regulator [Alicyclobacillus sp.]|nr:GntR family transcriptional regulator [Alicyclobacillus sp.]
MEIFLDVGSETPLYQQIRDQVVVGIAEGRLRDGEALPPTRQLAADFGINFHTVHKAYDLLRQDGLVRVSRKTGAVVSVQPPSPGFPELWREQARVWLAEAWLRGWTREQVLQRCVEILDQFVERGSQVVSDSAGGASGAHGEVSEG